MWEPIIYFAGKIANKEWREECFPHNYPWDISCGSSNPDSFAVLCDGIRYGGPFFSECKHARRGHTKRCCTEETPSAVHHYIWHQNKGLIRNAQYVFAYINETDCFGTMMEVGMAASMRKDIVVCLGPSLSTNQQDDMWMLSMASTRPVWGNAARGFATAKQIWGI
jgi:hypothetical protein